MPLVSVVIPTYNRLDLLKDTLESVFSQSFSDFEVLVIDDGSTESLDHLIQQYADRATFIRLPHSGLPSIARNRGIKAARGKYIAFLDSDDLWLTDKLNIQVKVFSDNPDIALTCSDAFVIKHATQVKSDTLYLNDILGKTGFLLNDLINNNFIITSTCMVRSDVVNKTGNFSEDPAFRGIEDYELWLRIARHYKVQYIPVSLAVYRDADNSLRSEISWMRYFEGMERIYTVLQSELPATEEYKNTNKNLEMKIYETKVAKLRLYFERADRLHFRSLFRDLVITHPLRIPKLVALITRTYFKQLNTGIKEPERF